MKKKHRFTRPDNPFTAEVMDDIEAKVNVAMAKFKVLANASKGGGHEGAPEVQAERPLLLPEFRRRVHLSRAVSLSAAPRLRG